MTEEERDDAPAGPPSARTRLSAEEVADYLVEVGATLAADHQCGLAVGQGEAALHLGHGADAAVATVEAGDEQEATVAGRVGGGLGLVRLERDGDHHLGEHHARGQGQHRQGEGGDVVHRGLPWGGKALRGRFRLKRDYTITTLNPRGVAGIPTGSGRRSHGPVRSPL